MSLAFFGNLSRPFHQDFQSLSSPATPSPSPSFCNVQNKPTEVHCTKFWCCLGLKFSRYIFFIIIYNHLEGALLEKLKSSLHGGRLMWQCVLDNLPTPSTAGGRQSAGVLSWRGCWYLNGCCFKCPFNSMGQIMAGFWPDVTLAWVFHPNLNVPEMPPSLPWDDPNSGQQGPEFSF